MILKLTDEQVAALAGHTPGPWEAEPGRFSVVRGFASEGWLIADCGSCDSPDQADENTRLIAAAPNLLADWRTLRDRVRTLEADVAAADMVRAAEAKGIEIGRDAGRADERRAILAWISDRLKERGPFIGHERYAEADFIMRKVGGGAHNGGAS